MLTLGSAAPNRHAVSRSVFDATSYGGTLVLAVGAFVDENARRPKDRRPKCDQGDVAAQVWDEGQQK